MGSLKNEDSKAFQQDEEKGPGAGDEGGKGRQYAEGVKPKKGHRHRPRPDHSYSFLKRVRNPTKNSQKPWGGEIKKMWKIRLSEAKDGWGSP